MAENRKKFLLDENLGKLAKWLRMLGYDAAVYKSISIEKKYHSATENAGYSLQEIKKQLKEKNVSQGF